MDSPSMSYMTLYLLTVHITLSNSRTSTHWRLDQTTGQVTPVVALPTGDLEDAEGSATAAPGMEDADEERVMNILIGHQGTSWEKKESWVVKEPSEPSSKATSVVSAECQQVSPSLDSSTEYKVQSDTKSTPSSKASSSNTSSSSSPSPSENRTLNCRPFTNFTQYDHLKALSLRHTLPLYPEPEVALIFRKKSDTKINLEQLAIKLNDSLHKKPKSPQVYNQLGNFLRIEGDSVGAVECFRRALALSPNQPDVLLNLARVLFNHNFLEDAIYLSRRSLETQQPGRNSWLQHFTLGEILKAYGQTQEAVHHFRQAQDLKPGFAPTQTYLAELEHSQSPSLTVSTLFLILILVFVVVFFVICSIEPSESCGDSTKTQRHFNRAMAMKTLKLGLQPKFRCRKPLLPPPSPPVSCDTSQ